MLGKGVKNAVFPKIQPLRYTTPTFFVAGSTPAYDILELYFGCEDEAAIQYNNVPLKRYY